MYPYMTFEDGTEVVHSHIISDHGIDKVYVHLSVRLIMDSIRLAANCPRIPGQIGRGIFLLPKKTVLRTFLPPMSS